MNKNTLPGILPAQRSSGGDTLVALLVATTIMGVVGAGLFALMSLNVAESAKTFNKTDTLNAARTALDKMGRLVRQARTVGDVQGETLPTSDPFAGFPSGPSTDTFAIKGNTVTLAQVESGTATNRSAVFPSAGDPFYGPNGSQTIANWPWGGGPNTGYRLAADTLVVQVPTFDANGYPNCVANTGQVLGQTLAALDTYVFKVVPDNSRPGPTKWFNLQMAAFPAPPDGATKRTNIASGITPGAPITILSGIIGPLDAQGNPVIFQYIKSSDNSINTNFAAGSQAENDLVLYNGVVANIQVMQLGNPQATMTSLRSEMYLRNNSQAQIIGPNN